MRPFDILNKFKEFWKEQNEKKYSGYVSVTEFDVELAFIDILDDLKRSNFELYKKAIKRLEVKNG